MPLASWNQNGPLPLADPQSLRGAVLQPENYEASLTLSSVRRPTEIGIGRHEKPDTNAGLIANIFQTSVMGKQTNIRPRGLRTKIHRNQKIGNSVMSFV
jgi:hypothetical protein